MNLENKVGHEINRKNLFEVVILNALTLSVGLMLAFQVPENGSADKILLGLIEGFICGSAACFLAEFSGELVYGFSMAGFVAGFAYGLGTVLWLGLGVGFGIGLWWLIHWTMNLHA